MHPPLLTLIRQHMHAQPIALHRLQLVRLAPVDVGASRFTRTVDYVRRFDLVEDVADLFLFVHAGCGTVHGLALGFEKRDELGADPALSAPDEEDWVRGGHLVIQNVLLSQDQRKDLIPR